MKRYIFRLLVAFTVIGFFATACSQIEEPVYEQTQNNRVAIRATINNTLATHVALTNDPDNKNGTFPSTFASAGSVKASYPATTPADYSSQGGTLADVEELLTLEASIDVTANQSTTGLNLKFNHNSAIIKMALTNEAFKSKSVNVELYAEGLLSGSNIISAEGITADADGQVTAYFAVPATGKEVKNCAIYATAGETTYKTTLGNNTITSGNLYNIAKSDLEATNQVLACYLPKGEVFRDAVVAAIGTLESVQIKFIANSKENLAEAKEIGTGTGAYIKVNGSVIEIHTAALEFVFNEDCSDMFNTYKIKNVNFNSCITTEKVTDMKNMFANCINLMSLELSNFNTEKVTDMKYMFNNCNSLTSLELSKLSKFSTTNVIYMQGMFSGCSGIASLDLSNFNTENVKDMNSMFYNCRSLTYLELSNFNTKNVTNMMYMFCSCNVLKFLDLTSFNASKVTKFENMFSGLGSESTSKPISVKVTKATYNILSAKSTGIDENYAKYVIE